MAGIEREPHDRDTLANAFVVKVILNLATTRAVIERLTMDRALKRLCGFPMSILWPACGGTCIGKSVPTLGTHETRGAPLVSRLH